MGETRQEQDEATQSEVEEIEAERERRLAPENRPENAEIDNTDAELPTVKEFEELNADDDPEGSAGSADPSEVFREMKPSEEEVAEIEEERKRRLDPDNRPENAEVDNTGDTGSHGDAGPEVADDEP
ncbi:hypothetical protein [Nocardioides ungokensis]|uniref:hypothetical protein n=1 Tax=Nocardioides ungokensis TaxID=1643322 RepID=UPI0015DD8046|nr:hypothetical protein [Nocardioides ungokensis]